MTAVHVGYLDTDMADYVTTGKEDPALVAGAALDAVEAATRRSSTAPAAAQVRGRLSAPLGEACNGLGLPASLQVVGA